MSQGGRAKTDVSSGTVIGPGSSINGDIVIFSGITGKIIADSGVAFPIPVASGGTGDITLAAHGVLIGEGTSSVAVTAAGTDGQVLTAVTGADPAFSNIGTNSGLTAHGLLLGQGNSAFSSVSTGNVGYVLKSNGSGSDPTFQAATWINGPGSSTDRAISTWNGTTGSSLFDNSTATIDSTGRYVNTAQPCFSVYLTTTIANITGDVTYYTIIYDTILTNVGTSFNIATGLFTAPKTGKYIFTYSCVATTTSNYNDCTNFIVINGSSLYKNFGTKQNISTQYNGAYSIVLPLTSGDTVGIQVNADTVAGTKNTSLTGSATNRPNNFSGILLS